MSGLDELSVGVAELLDAFDDGSAYKGMDFMEFFYTGRRIEA
jgi:hypothetical protein